VWAQAQIAWQAVAEQLRRVRERRRLTTGNSQRRPGRYSSIEDVIDVSLLSCRAEAAA
jgi:hypothetical protein